VEDISFLRELMGKGRTPSTLKVYVAAIAAFAKTSDWPVTGEE